MRVRSQYNLGPNPLLTKVLSIGVWDMVASGNVNIVHGLSAPDIRFVTAIIYPDVIGNVYPMEYSNNYTEMEGRIVWDATFISLFRRAGGVFDQIDFVDGVMNRGFITIKYV